MARTNFKSVAEYIASHPPTVRGILRRVRSAIRKAVPRAEETISYQIPLAPYEVNDKGTIRFPVSEPVPVKLIDAMAKFRAKEVAEN